MHARTWAILVAVAAAGGIAGGYGIGQLIGPTGPPLADTSHAAQLNVTVACQTPWTCNVTLSVDGQTKWTIPIGCDNPPCSVLSIPTLHNWIGAASCEAFTVEARSAITDTKTVTLCDEETTSIGVQASGIPPDRSAQLNVTIVCGTASDCTVTLFVDGAQKWTVVVPCTSPPCIRADIATPHTWAGNVCKDVVVEARSEINDTATGALCGGQTVVVVLQAEGPAPRDIGASISLSADGTNWTVFITTVPPGLAASDTFLGIFNPGGATALPYETFNSLSYAQDGAVFVGDGDSIVELGERLLISTIQYPTGYRIEIRDSLGLLYVGMLQ
ncbi:MAG TPA: hypothetical protein VJ300_05250 [Thermoplasmata archaeon]|nr:hypothetical protein [Thermoplasmata archaeon]